MMVRVFANGPGYRGSTLGRLKKLVLDASLLNIQYYKIRINIIRYGLKVSGAIQEKELSPPMHLGVVPIEKGTFRSPSTTVSQLNNNNHL